MKRPILLLVAMIAALCVASRYGAVAGVLAIVAVSALLTPRAAACYANNFGVLNNTVLIFDAFSQFLGNLLPIRSMVLDTQDPTTGAREAKPGDTITIKDWRSAVTAYQPGSEGYATLSNVAINSKDRQITMPNSPWAVSIALTPAEYRILSSGEAKGVGYETFRDKLSNLMRDGLGKKAIESMFAVITADNYSTNFDSAPGTFSRAAEVDLEAVLFGRSVPTQGAQIITTPTLYAEWVKDRIAIQTNTGQDRPKDLLMSGGVPSDTTNFVFWRTNVPMPTDAPRGFALTKTAIIAVFRIPDEPTYENDPVSLATYIDPLTGIPLLARVWKSSLTGVMQLDLASMFAFARGQSEALERITEPEEEDVEGGGGGGGGGV